jgi:glycosyltransferase involved in cell wall biosynthesis
MISACIIAGSGAPGLERAISSVRPMVDEVVLVRTADVGGGSGADTCEVFTDGNFAADCSCGCGSKAGQLADFGLARNRSFELAKGDWITWLDADDVIDGDDNALRDLASRDIARALFVYAYSQEQSYYLPRLVRAKERWIYPIHEFLSGIEGERSNRLVWRHERTADGTHQSAERNWRLMSHHMTTHAGTYEHDARMWYYWGRAAADVGKAIPALSRLERAYALETWKDQRAVISMLLARVLPTHLVDMRRHWGWLAVQNAPRWPIAWRALAGTYDGDEREDFLRHADSLPPEDSFLVTHA